MPASGLRGACKIGLSAAILAVLYTHVGPGKLAAMWRGAAPGRLAGGAALGLLGLAVQWVKWHRLLVAVRPGSSWGESLASLLGGFTLGALSPGRLGELGRGVFLSDRRLPASAGAVADRLSSFAVTVCLGLVGVWFFEPLLAARALAAVAVVALAMWAARAYLGRRGQGRGIGWPPLIREGLGALAPVGTRRWLEVLGWSAVFNSVFLVQFYVFAGAWGPVPDTLIPAIPAIFAVKALVPLGFMDLGIREGAAVFFYTRLGLDPAAGLSAALMVFGVNVLAPAAAGLAAIARMGRWPRPDAAPEGAGRADGNSPPAWQEG